MVYEILKHTTLLKDCDAVRVSITLFPGAHGEEPCDSTI